MVSVQPKQTTYFMLHTKKGAWWCSAEAAGSKLGPGASCWKIGSYSPMPGGLQCRILTN